MPNGRKSSQAAERLLNEQEILRLHLKGLNQTEIGAEMGLKMGQAQVSRTLTRLRKRLATENMESTEVYRNREQLKLDYLERQYWQSYEESKNESSPAGDGRFLDGVGKCIQARCKLFALDIPPLQRQEVLMLGSDAKLSESARVARIAGLLDSARARQGASGGAVIDGNTGQVH